MSNQRRARTDPPRRRDGGSATQPARLLVALAAACGCADAPSLATRSFALAAPELTEPAFEPHLSIDPDDPDRIVVAAHYGVGYNRGGRKIWSWQTDDGGRRWTGLELPPPSAETGLAADAVTGFDLQGTALVTYLFADTSGRRFNGGAALARGTGRGPGFGPAMVVTRGGLDSPAGAAVDKGWLAVDRGATSPHRGRVYLSWHLNRPDFTTGTVHSTFWLAASHDGGATFSEPTRVAEAFHGQVAAGPDGTVHVIFGGRAGRALLHAASTDAGRSFGPPDTVVTLGDSIGVDVPHLTVTARGLLVCWAEAPREGPARYTVRCARSGSGLRWEPPVAVAPDLPPESALGFPVTAAAQGGVWLLAYRADPDTVRVVLLRSTDGGASFAPARELARRALPASRFCIAAGAACRRAPDAFFPGDYAGLAATASRVAAAYVLPEGDSADGRPTVYVTVMPADR